MVSRVSRVMAVGDRGDQGDRCMVLGTPPKAAPKASVFGVLNTATSTLAVI